MVIFWRGFGLIVPIVIALCAWIVSYWFDDTRIGNASYSGWVCFYSAIILLLPGFGMWGGTNNEDGTRSRHDFMFIPVLFWSLGLGAISAYVLLTRDSEPDTSTTSVVDEEDDEEDEPAKVYRVVNFVNSSSDSMTVVIRDDQGEVERLGLGSKAWNSLNLEVKKYTFTSYNSRDEIVFKWKDKEITAADETAAYTSQWVQMDGGEHNMILIDLTPLWPEDFMKSDLQSVDWSKQIITTYKADDIMSPSFPKDAGDKDVILEPGDLIPAPAKTGRKIYGLLNVPADQELNNEYLVERLGNQYFK